VHTALRIEPAYKGPVVHVLDASRAVGVATTLVSETIRDDYVAKIADEYEAVRVARANRGQSELVPIDKARDNAFDADMSPQAGQAAPAGRPRVPRLGPEGPAHLYRLDAVLPRLGAGGNYPAILTDKVVGESATSLFADARRCSTNHRREMADRARRRGAVAVPPAGRRHHRPCRGRVHFTLPMLRQQIAKREGRANMCLADFIDP
jgi:5-methyltetrahydrofolate--homocysteine methyltransferase